MSDGPFHIFTRAGDGTRDVEGVLRDLAARGLSAEAAGYVKHLVVTRADQTVVFLVSRDAPFADALRRLPAWREPGDQPLG